MKEKSKKTDWKCRNSGDWGKVNLVRHLEVTSHLMANRNNFWYICIIVFQDLILPLVNYPSFFSFDLLLFKYRPFPLLQEKKISKIMKLEIIAVPQYEQYHRYIFFILMVWSIKNIVMVVHSSCICPKHSQKQS